MIFPFRTSTIFRNRWVALLWAAGICFTAMQIVDTVAGTGDKHGAPSASSDEGNPVAIALGNVPPPGGAAVTDHIAQ